MTRSGDVTHRGRSICMHPSVWTPANGAMLLASGDEIQAAMYSGGATMVAWALGGNL